MSDGQEFGAIGRGSKVDLIALRYLAQCVADDARKKTALHKEQAAKEAEAEFWRNVHRALYSGELGPLHYADEKNEITRCLSKSRYQSIARANILSPQNLEKFSHLKKYGDLELLKEGYLSVGYVDATRAMKWYKARQYPQPPDNAAATLGTPARKRKAVQEAIAAIGLSALEAMSQKAREEKIAAWVCTERSPLTVCERTASNVFRDVRNGNFPKNS